MGSTPESESRLFKPLKLGRYTISSRLAMAPLTRYRANGQHVQLPFVNLYYSQRACVPGTFIITEATPISPQAGGLHNVPGIWTQEQIAAWKEVVDRVHEAGSIIFLQLWAVGRMADPKCMEAEGTGDVVSSSDVPYEDGAPKPRPMTEAEIEQYIKDYATAARNAVEGAGFDGIELHGANGYLIDQFIQDVSNKRNDKWGGSIENRSRFGLEATKAVVEAVGADKTGIKLSPWSDMQGMKMDDPVPQFSHLITELKKLKLAYIHLSESRVTGGTETNDHFIKLWSGTSPILLNGGFTPELALTTVDEDYTEEDIIIVFGRYFISTPDLVFRMKKGIELQQYDRSTFYLAQSEKGYIDYPFSEEWHKERSTITPNA